MTRHLCFAFFVKGSFGGIMFLAILALLTIDPMQMRTHDGLFTPIARRSCKQVESCEEAVKLWCSGYSRADGDGDGIPCENVCHSLARVEEIRKAIGC